MTSNALLELAQAALASAQRLQSEADTAAQLQRQQDSESAADSSCSTSATELKKQAKAKILKLHCPSCNAMFCPTSGSVAVKCASCKTAFCAICLQNCGKDATAHARACKYRRSHCSHFWKPRLSMDDVRNAQIDWRVDALRAMLGPVDTLVATEVLLGLRTELLELNLDVSSVRGGMILISLLAREVCSCVHASSAANFHDASLQNGSTCKLKS